MNIRKNTEMNDDLPNDYAPSLIEDVCRWAYSFILTLAIPFTTLYLLYKSSNRNKDVDHSRFERFGFVSPPPKMNGYLFHCVSVGEVVTASCLIKRIMQEEPNAQITITTTTSTGSARVRDIFGKTVHHFYLPFDLQISMSLMLNRIKPKTVLITEVELWPNLIHVCWKRNIPVLAINARMTDRSVKNYIKIKYLFSPMLHKLSHICAQGERDYKNYITLGADKSRITLTQNIKFDQAAAQQTKLDTFKGLNKNAIPTLVAGSTHELEESALLSAMKQLWKTHPTLRLIIVPRHPERFLTVKKILENQNESFECTSESQQISPNTRLVLLDEMGKLNSAYQIANIAFVGGSLADKGGHNALEPAALSVPVIMGPNTYNNPLICEILAQRGALVIVKNTNDIVSQCSYWLSNPDKALNCGSAGRQVLDENSGALEKTWLKIKSFD